ncbi:MAG: DUF2938 domain-containing protein [Gammaproteobacteria bacterium]|nr:DUF2938 domain-containing protein [Gammaproteobacteria bacterium]
MKHLLDILWTGLGAPAAMALWALLRRRRLGTPLPNYGLVGRWIGHMPRGRLVHQRIAAAPAVPGERTIGWVAHVTIGVAFAALVPAIFGNAWLGEPSLVPALLVGIGTVAAPLLVMQPAMGAGIAARRLPNPRAARLQSLVTHTVFGLGLYLAARVSSSLS